MSNNIKKVCLCPTTGCEHILGTEESESQRNIRLGGSVEANSYFMQAGDMHCFKCHKNIPNSNSNYQHTANCPGEIKPCKEWNGKTCEFSEGNTEVIDKMMDIVRYSWEYLMVNLSKEVLHSDGGGSLKWTEDWEDRFVTESNRIYDEHGFIPRYAFKDFISQERKLAQEESIQKVIEFMEHEIKIHKHIMNEHEGEIYPEMYHEGNIKAFERAIEIIKLDKQ